jgi:ABC-2 type transport system ATP-binding protein
MIVRDLDAAQIHVEDLALRRPTLDDVFLTLTGRAAEEEEADFSFDLPAARTLERSAR